MLVNAFAGFLRTMKAFTALASASELLKAFSSFLKAVYGFQALSRALTILPAFGVWCSKTSGACVLRASGPGDLGSLGLYAACLEVLAHCVGV